MNFSDILVLILDLTAFFFAMWLVFACYHAAVLCYKKHLGSRVVLDNNRKYILHFICYLFYFVCGVFFFIQYFWKPLGSGIGMMGIYSLIFTLLTVPSLANTKKSMFDTMKGIYIGGIIALYVLTVSFLIIFNVVSFYTSLSDWAG